MATKKAKAGTPLHRTAWFFGTTFLDKNAEVSDHNQVVVQSAQKTRDLLNYISNLSFEKRTMSWGSEQDRTVYIRRSKKTVLEGRFVTSRRGSEWVVNDKDDDELHSLPTGKSLCDLSHFIWIDLTKFPSRNQTQLSPGGLLVCEFNHFAPRAHWLESAVRYISQGSVDAEIQHIWSDTATSILQRDPRALELVIKVPATPASSMRSAELAGLDVPTPIDGNASIEIRWKPEPRSGPMNVARWAGSILQRFKQSAPGTFDVRYRDAEDVARHLAKDFLNHKIEVKRRSTRNEIPEPESVYTALRDAVRDRIQELSHGLNRSIPPTCVDD